MALAVNKVKSLLISRTWNTRDFVVFYSIMYAIAALLAFFAFLQEGKSFVLGADGLVQYYTAVAYLGQWVREGVSAGFSFPMWESSLGFGADVIGTLSYYSFGDPLDLLAVFVPEQYTEYLIDFLYLFRIYLAGLFFGFYCRVMGKKDVSVVLGGLGYAFSGWSLVMGIRYLWFLNPLMYLPLMLIGVERIYRYRKPALFVLVMFVLAVGSFYFIYTMTVAVASYAVLRFFTMPHEKPLKEFAVWGLRFVAYGFLGVVMASVLLLPTVIAYTGAMRGNVKQQFSFHYPLSYYMEYLRSFIAIGHVEPAPEGRPNIGLTAPLLLGVFALFGMKDAHRKAKLAFIVCTVLVLFPAAANALNMFAYVTDRWEWIFIFIIAYCFVLAWPSLISPTSRQIACIATMSIVYVALILVSRDGTNAAYAAGGILLCSAALVIVCRNVNNRSQAGRREWLTPVSFTLIVLIGLFSNAHFIYDKSEIGHVSDFVDAGQVWKKVTEGPLDAVASYMKDDKEFSRAEEGWHYLRNTSVFEGLSSTGFYWSIANGDITRAQLDNGLTGMHMMWCYFHLDQRTFLDELASVKYYVGPENSEPYGYVPVDSFELEGVIDPQKVEYTLYENSNPLPFGYTYDSYITKNEFDDTEIPLRQEAMMQSVVLEEHELYEIPDEIQHGGVTHMAKQLDYTVELQGKIEQVEQNVLAVADPSGMVTLRFDGLPNSETYVYFKGMEAHDEVPYELYHDGDQNHFSTDEFEAMPKDAQMYIIGQGWKTSSWPHSAFFVYFNVKNFVEMNKYVIYVNPYFMYPSASNDFCINLGYSDKERHATTMKPGSRGIYSFEDVQIVSQPMDEYDTWVDTLKQDTLQDVEFSTNRITGSIELDKPKVLCMSLPYHPGWKAYDNGEEITPRKANQMYTALVLRPGSHSIELRYETPGLKLGAIISACAFAAFAVMLALGRMRNRASCVAGDGSVSRAK